MAVDSLLMPIISAGVSAVVSYYVSLFLKDKEYKNDYYKKVIDKRMAAYQYVENLILELQYYTVGNDGRKFHPVFLDTEKYKVFFTHLKTAVKSGIWLSNNAESQLSHLNKVIFDASMKADFSKVEDLIEAGKANYEIIRSMNGKLKEMLRYDLHHMHDAERFFTYRR
jgi:hypothetical protein